MKRFAALILLALILVLISTALGAALSWVLNACFEKGGISMVMTPGVSGLGIVCVFLADLMLGLYEERNPYE